MAKIYYSLIEKGLRTLDDVPDLWKEQVRELLEGDELWH